MVRSGVQLGGNHCSSAGACSYALHKSAIHRLVSTRQLERGAAAQADGRRRCAEVDGLDLAQGDGNAAAPLDTGAGATGAEEAAVADEDDVTPLA